MKDFLIKKYGSDGVIDLFSEFITEKRIQRFKQSITHRILNVAVVVENLYDLHNAAAVTRSAEAFGVMKIFFIGNRENWKITKKISIQADKWIDIKFCENIDEVHSILKDFIHWVAIPPSPSRPTSEVNFNKTPLSMRQIDTSGNLALWFGNERHGLSDEAVNKADFAFFIPLFGLSQSLNLSVSAAIATEYVCYQKRLKNDIVLPDNDLSSLLLANYLISSVKPEYIEEIIKNYI